MSLEELKQLEMQELSGEETLIRVLKLGQEQLDRMTDELERKDKELIQAKDQTNRSNRLIQSLEEEVKILREENKQLRRLTKGSDYPFFRHVSSDRIPDSYPLRSYYSYLLFNAKRCVPHSWKALPNSP